MNLTETGKVVLLVKNLPATAGDVRDANLIPGLRRSPKGRKGNTLQCSCLENSMVGGAWWATVRGVTESVKTEHTHKQD